MRVWYAHAGSSSSIIVPICDWILGSFLLVKASCLVRINGTQLPRYSSCDSICCCLLETTFFYPEYFSRTSMQHQHAHHSAVKGDFIMIKFVYNSASYWDFIAVKTCIPFSVLERCHFCESSVVSSIPTTQSLYTLDIIHSHWYYQAHIIAGLVFISIMFYFKFILGNKV